MRSAAEPMRRKMLAETAPEPGGEYLFARSPVFYSVSDQAIHKSSSIRKRPMIDRKRLTNDHGAGHRFRLVRQLSEGRRYRVALNATFQGSSASIWASVMTCGGFSKMWRRYA